MNESRKKTRRFFLHALIAAPAAATCFKYRGRTSHHAHTRNRDKITHRTIAGETKTTTTHTRRYIYIYIILYVRLCSSDHGVDDDDDDDDDDDERRREKVERT